MIRFRLATLDDIPRIAPIELAAGAAFRDIGMGAVADDDPIAENELAQAVAEGRLWIASDFGTIRAYLLAIFLPECVHIEQLTVHPDAARRGIGAMLIESVCSDARVIASGVLTLITFRDVPWNAPYYRRICFADLAEESWPAGVADIVHAEQAKGWAMWPRVVMARDLARASENE